jgi:hypothetical protein
MGLKTSLDEYVEPDLFIFSDYFPYRDSTFFDTGILFADKHTSIYVEEFCEIFPSVGYHYFFDENHVAFKPSRATGRAIFFKAKVTSNNVENSYYKYAIYFFYENVNLIEQLFLINKLPFSHFVWLRDGTGLGGGYVSLRFMYNVAYKARTKYFFIWSFYQNELNTTIDSTSYNVEESPDILRNYLHGDIEYTLQKKVVLKWSCDDYVNLYFSNYSNNSVTGE